VKAKKTFDKMSDKEYIANMNRTKNLKQITCLFFIVSISISSSCVEAATPAFTDKNCIRAVTGEARGEGYTGMLHCAVAIRNRGTLQGVYGYNAKFTEPEYVWEKARKAWEESEYYRTHCGDHWGGKGIDEGWILKMENSGYKKVLEYKKQIYYKSR